MKRIGLLTSGGDCQGLNAMLRGVAKGLYNIYGNGMELFGLIDGYKGLMYEDYRKLTPVDFTGLLTSGGTILGSSRQPFKEMRKPDANGLDKVEAMKYTYRRLRLDCLVVLGGNGSQKTANLLSEEGLNVIGLLKTIDNDLWGWTPSSASRAPLRSPPMSSTASTPPLPPTAVSSLWRSWGTRRAG